MNAKQEILELLGGNPDNLDHLSMLVTQFGTRSGVLPFVGAGMSKPFGFPEWGVFLRELAELAGTTKEINRRLEASAYEEAASDLLEALGPRRFHDLLADRFGDRKISNRRLDGALAEIPRLPTGPVITTNFDHVLETVFQQAGKPLQAFWHSLASKGSQALQQDRPFLLKLHGDWTDQETRVLTLSEYAKAYGAASAEHISFTLPIPALLYTLLASRSCLFLGCSLRQDRTVQFLRLTARGLPEVVHYAVVEEPESREDLRRRAAELSAQGIRPIWYPHSEHDVIRPLLAYLALSAGESSRLAASQLLVAMSRPSHVPNNIPMPGNLTVGREAEVNQIQNMLRGAPLVTICGVGGCGKSRLAIELAMSLKNQYDDGVWFIQLSDLGAKADHERVVPTRIGRTVGVPEQAGQPPNEALVEHFRKGKFLLVLDNCEHLIHSCHEVLNYLLQRCSDLAVLATSRRPLKLPQERLFPLAPLQTPDPQRDTFSELEKNDSVRLFVERARQRRPEYKLAPENARAVAGLCCALEGIPLALEVAAARLSVRSVEQMNLESRSLLSTIGNLKSGDLRPWKTLTAALRWSYGLLHPHEQVFMQSLAVFEGGWTEEAAEAVYRRPAGDGASVSDHLFTLFDNSLVLTTEINQRKRFRFLEPIRQLVQMQLTAERRLDAEQRHAMFFLDMAEQGAPELLKSSQAEWLDKLQSEADNLRAAIRWSIAAGKAETGLPLITALWRFTEIRGGLEEGRQRAMAVLEIPGTENFPALRSKVLSGAGMLAYRQGEFDIAETLFLRSLEFEERCEPEGAGLANALNDLGNVARMKGDLGRARQLHMRCLDAEEKNRNGRGVSVAMFNLGCVALAAGQNDEAKRYFDESARGFRESGNERESGFPLNGLSLVALTEGDVAAAYDYAQRSLRVRKRVKDAKGVADSLATLGWIAIEAGDFVDAKNYLAESVTMAQGLMDKRGASEALELIALLASRRGLAWQAVALFAAAEQIRGKFSYSPAQLRVLQRRAELASARAALTDANYARAWRRGTSFTTAEAIEFALTEDQTDAMGRS